MISKEKFVKIINQLIEFHKVEKTIIVDLLREMFQDKKNNWIGYCLYELDYFKKYKTIYVNGEIIKLSNAGELYDLLIKNMEV